MPRYQVGTHKHQKGYPRVSAGPLRGQYVHRIIAEAMLGRKLKADEDVHHRDGNVLNFHPSNLQVIGHKDHGYVSSKQRFYMKQKDGRLKQEFEAFLAAKYPGTDDAGGGGVAHGRTRPSATNSRTAR